MTDRKPPEYKSTPNSDANSNRAPDTACCTTSTVSIPEGPGIAPDFSWDESYRDARANESARSAPTRGNPGTRVAR